MTTRRRPRNPRRSHAGAAGRTGLAGFAGLAGLAAALLLAAPSPVAAQSCPDGRPWDLVVAGPETVQRVALEGGATYQGRTLDTGDPIRFELLSGDVLEIAHSRITCLRVAAGTVQGAEFWPADRNDTRLFFGPTGRALPRGTGYLSVFEVVFPLVAVGLTDRITLAAGMPLFFTSDGIQMFWFAPKVEVVRTPTVRASAGTLLFLERGDSYGVLYGVATIGETSDRAFTAGAGWGYSSRDGLGDAPALMGGFEVRAGRNVKLISENYLFPDEGFGLISFGPRFFGERLSADLGLAAPFGSGGELFVFPLINFVYNW